MTWRSSCLGVSACNTGVLMPQTLRISIDFTMTLRTTENNKPAIWAGLCIKMHHCRLYLMPYIGIHFNCISSTPNTTMVTIFTYVLDCHNQPSSMTFLDFYGADFLQIIVSILIGSLGTCGFMKNVSNFFNAQTPLSYWYIEVNININPKYNGKHHGLPLICIVEKRKGLAGLANPFFLLH